jgi:hypothetical protein
MAQSRPFPSFGFCAVQNKDRAADQRGCGKKLGLDLLSERAAMLADVRDEVSAMKRALGEILREIKIPR